MAEDAVLVFEVVEEKRSSASSSSKLYFFLYDGTASVAQESSVFFDQKQRYRLYDSRGKRLKPVDLVVGGRVEWQKRWFVIVDADSSTRRFYARLGCGLAQELCTKSTESRPREDQPLVFRGRDDLGRYMDLEFSSLDLTTRVLACGVELVPRGKYFFDFDRRGPDEPSWRLLAAALKSRRPIRILGRTHAGPDLGPIFLDEWLVLSSDPSRREEEQQLSPPKKTSNRSSRQESLRFGLILSGVVRGRNPRDAVRPLIATVFKDLTVSIAFADDASDILLVRGIYRRRLADRSKPLLASDFSSLMSDDDVLTIETARAQTTLYAFKRCRKHDDDDAALQEILPFYFFRNWDSSSWVSDDAWDPRAALCAAAHVVSWRDGTKEAAEALATFALRQRLAGIDLRSGLQMLGKLQIRDLDEAARARLRSLLPLTNKMENNHLNECAFLLNGSSTDDVSDLLAKVFEQKQDLIDSVALVAAAAFHDTARRDPGTSLPRLLALLGLRVGRGFAPPVSLRQTLREKNDLAAAFAYHGLRPLADPAEFQKIASRFAEAKSIDDFCDDFYLADFSRHPPATKQTIKTPLQETKRSSPPLERKDEAWPRQAAPAEVARAQRAFATAFGRSYRHRQLRMRLLSQANGASPAAACVARSDLLAAVDHVLSEGEINLRRSVIITLADFLYASPPQKNNIRRLPCVPLLAALFTLDGPGKLSDLHYDAAASS